MRYPGWLLLFAGMVVTPQVALSAAAWGESPYDGGWQTPGNHRVPAPGQYRPAPPAQPVAVAPGFADQGARLRAAGYRFRPWQGPAPRVQQPQGHYPIQAPVASYPMHQPSWRRTAPAAVTTPSPYPYAGYRFRPNQRLQAQGQSAPRYRPVQVQIPDRYVFRPLNPVTRQAPLRPSVARAPVASAYTAPAGGHWPGNAYYYSPQQRSQSPYQAYRYAPPQRMNRMVGFPDPRRMAAYPPYPPVPVAYAPGIRPMPQFRPRPGSEVPRRPAQAKRQVYARGYPHQRRYAPGPTYAWRQQVRPHFARYPAPHAYAPGGVYPPSASSNRYGMDWYDGRGDGEGAWYSLTLKSEPIVSQYQEPWAVTPYDQAN